MNRLTGRQIVKMLGYSGFFVVAFLFFFVWCFPIERFGRLMEQQLGGFLGREVTIGETDLSLTGSLVLSQVEIGVPSDQQPVVEPISNGDSKAKNEGKKTPKKRRLAYMIDEISVDIGMLALAFGELAVDVDVEALGGTLRFDFEGPLALFSETVTKGESARSTRARDGEDKGDDAEKETPIHLEVEIAGILLERVHDLKTLLPVPVKGTLNFSLELDSPTSKLAESTGQIVVALDSVILSRKNFESEMFGMNLAVPPIVITTLDSEVVFEKGAGKVAKFDLQSKHIDGNVQGGVSLKDPLSKSQMDLYFTLKPLPAYIDKSNILKTLMPNIDSLSKDAKKAHRADGYFGFRYTGIAGKGGRFVAAKDYTPRGRRTARAGRTKRGRSRARTSRRPRTPRPQTRLAPPGELPPDAPVKPAEADIAPKPARETPTPIREPRSRIRPPVPGTKRGTRGFPGRDDESVKKEEEEEEEESVEEEGAEEESEEEAEEGEESEAAETPEKDEELEGAEEE
jgi:type II secretion system protein N